MGVHLPHLPEFRDVPGQNGWVKASRELVPMVKSVASREGTFIRGAGPSPPRVPAVQVIRRIRASGPRVLLTVLAQHVHEVARAQRGTTTATFVPLSARGSGLGCAT